MSRFGFHVRGLRAFALGQFATAGGAAVRGGDASLGWFEGARGLCAGSEFLGAPFGALAFLLLRLGASAAVLQWIWMSERG